MSKMDPDESLIANALRELSSSGSGQHPFIDFATRLQNQEGVDFLNFGEGIESQFSELSRSAEILSTFAGEPSSQTQNCGNDGQEIANSNSARDWDPNDMLNNLSSLEQKIHQLQGMVHLIIARRSQAGSQSDELLVQQQQLITADLTSIIIQLLSTAGRLLPSMKHSPSTVTPQVDQLGQSSGSFIPPAVTPQVDQLGQSSGSFIPPAVAPQVDQLGQSSVENVENVADQSNEMDITGNNTPVQNGAVNEHEGNDEDGDDGENLPPGSYEILQLEKEEILAPLTHFCTVCGKGFKRDANLRMHMRGHGEVYKTTAALARPGRDLSLEASLIKRYSCPFLGCKRNKDHKKFQPLKTITCVKNHYKRTHCDKSYVCSRCQTKRFSVIADLKTHEKHCGRDRWLCSCGTTFSRKDKLLSHISLFQTGHTPAIPFDDPPNAAFFPPPLPPRGPSPAIHSLPPSGPSPGPPDADALRSEASSGNIFREPIPFSPLSYDSSEFPAFARPVCDDTDSSFSFPISFS